MSNQLFNPLSIDMLFNPVFLSIAVIAFVALLIVSWVYHKRLSKKNKVIFGLILAVLIVYFIFIAWMIVGFGSNHGSKP